MGRAKRHGIAFCLTLTSCASAGPVAKSTLRVAPDVVQAVVRGGTTLSAQGRCAVSGRRSPVPWAYASQVMKALRVARPSEGLEVRVAENADPKVINALTSTLSRALVRFEIVSEPASQPAPCLQSDMGSPSDEAAPAPAKTGVPRVDLPKGSLPKAHIADTVRAARPTIKACYEDYLALEPGVEGKVTIHFIIAPSGEVVLAEPVLNLVAPPVGRCIAEVVQGLRFDPPRGGGYVTVTYPFKLQIVLAIQPTPPKEFPIR